PLEPPVDETDRLDELLESVIDGFEANVDVPPLFFETRIDLLETRIQTADQRLESTVDRRQQLLIRHPTTLPRASVVGSRNSTGSRFVILSSAEPHHPHAARAGEHLHRHRRSDSAGAAGLVVLRRGSVAAVSEHAVRAADVCENRSALSFHKEVPA